MNAASTTTLTFTMLLFGIVYLLIIILRGLVDFSKFYNEENKEWFFFLAITYSFLNWFFLAREKRHQKIIEEFNNETEQQSKRGMIVAKIFIVISLGAPIVILLALYYFNKT
jgi:Na+/H+ antiporter NhaD/arsenite permease-like protein